MRIREVDHPFDGLADRGSGRAEIDHERAGTAESGGFGQWRQEIVDAQVPDIPRSLTSPYLSFHEGFGY